MADEAFAFSKAELRALSNTFKAMDDAAADEARKVTGGLAEFLTIKIQAASNSAGKAAQRIAEGGKVSKTSISGQITYGFASQKFSGGGSTRLLWGGYEFGSNGKYKQFGPRRTKGKFIFPTLKANQPAIVKAWENAFENITEKWG